MPHLIFRGVNKTDAKNIWDNTKDEIVKTTGVAEDWYTVEQIDTNQITEIPAFCEITWFDRPDHKDSIVKILTAEMKKYTSNEATVIFRPVSLDDYFEDGKNFK